MRNDPRRINVSDGGGRHFLFIEAVPAKAQRQGQGLHLGHSSLRDVRDLKQRIERFIERYDQDPRPFKWTATADSILAQATKIGNLISGTAH